MVDLEFDFTSDSQGWGRRMFKQSRGDSEELEARTGEVAEFYRLLFGQDADPDSDREFYEDDDDEGPFEILLRHAARIEAGLMPGWKLDRSQPDALVWTTPSGRRYKSTLDGQPLA
jgi:hypothetical protein